MITNLYNKSPGYYITPADLWYDTAIVSSSFDEDFLKLQESYLGITDARKTALLEDLDKYDITKQLREPLNIPVARELCVKRLIRSIVGNTLWFTLKEDLCNR